MLAMQYKLSRHLIGQARQLHRHIVQLLLHHGTLSFQRVQLRSQSRLLRARRRKHLLGASYRLKVTIKLSRPPLTLANVS